MVLEATDCNRSPSHLYEDVYVVYMRCGKADLFDRTCALTRPHTNVLYLYVTDMYKKIIAIFAAGLLSH